MYSNHSIGGVRMLTIQCTKKLIDYINKDIDRLPDIQDKLFSWHAHLFIVQRKKYIIIMNNQSRYNFVLGPLLKKDVKHLDDLIIEGIKVNLKADEIEQSMIDEYVKQMDEFSYTKTSERSIIGQINDCINYLEHFRNANGDLDLADINRRLNKFPMLKLPLTYSRKAMINDLQERYSH